MRLVLSFVLAVALWLYISSKQDPRVAQDYGQPIAVSVANIPDGMTIANNSLGVVYVSYRRASTSTVVTGSSFHPYVDLLGLKPGLHHVPIQVTSDPGVQVVDKRPSTVPILLERIQSRRISVQPHTLGQPPTGYGTQIIITPKTVVVSGAPDLVTQATRASFELDLRSLRSNVSGSYELFPENSQAGLVVGRLTLSPSHVHVTVKVQALSSYKTLPVLPTLTGTPKTGYGVVGVTVQPAEITASGSPGALSAISTVKTGSVSVSKRGAGTITRRVAVKLPKGIRSSTKWVTVRAQLAAVQSGSSIEIGITPVGVSPGLSARTNPAKVLVSVVGPSTTLSQVARQMHAVVDLTGYGAGTYTFTPSITAPRGIVVEGSYPTSVTVTLTPSS